MLDSPIPPPPIRGVFRTDENARAVYSESAGIARLWPTGVAVPADADDVVSLAHWAADLQVPLVARGSGSSMSGAAVGGGVIVDLGRIRTMDDVDVAARRLRVGPGVTRAAVEHSANAVSLRFPVDPSSGAFATIGGMTGTNASGPRSLRHGPMRRWVTALDCVFADGSRAVVRRGAALPGGNELLAAWTAASAEIRERARRLPPRLVRKQSSGYGVHDFAESGDLIDLLVGSEGTLAQFVGIELALAGLPDSTASLLASWRSLDDATEGASIAREAGAAACELLDRTFLDVAASGGTLVVPDDVDAMLLVEVELESSSDPSERVQGLARALERAGATAIQLGIDAESEEALWTLRHAASPILARLDPHLKSMQLVEDGCVPPGCLADYVRGVRRALDAEGMRGVIFGHAGDAHVHVNALVDVRDADWRERVRRLFDAVVTLTARLGGTLAGEHGDGRLRTPFLHRTWSPEALDLFRAIKSLFDPAGILNPGVKVDVGAPAIFSSIKYDPDLAPLPPGARDALARVERERAWDRNRLEMLEDGR